MHSKRILPVLFMLILLITAVACDDFSIGAPAADPAPVEAGPTPVDTAPAPQSEAYPAPPQGEVLEEAQAYPAESAETAGGEPYPAPAANEAAAAAQAYPAPPEEPQNDADDVYPAPDTGAAEEMAVQEENSLLPQSADEATLTNRIWVFRNYDDPAGQTLLPATDVLEANTVEFFEDGRVTIIAGCIIARGAYSAGDGAIDIQTVNQSEAECETASLGSQFLQWLDLVDSYQIKEESLLLNMPGDAGGVQLQGSTILSFGDQLSKFYSLMSTVGIPDAQPETLEELMDTSLDQLVYQPGSPVNQSFGKAPGAVVLIQSPQGSMVKSAGVANVEDNKPMAAFDRLEIGSNTKMFTAVLLAQLQEEGVLSMNDPLSRWLPTLAENIPNGEAMTLRHLATHTSGIPDYGDAVIGAGAADSEALRSGYTPLELVLIATENAEPDFVPGEPGRWNYSNTGYILLGMVLEAATGQSYGDLLQQRIFGPLQMDDSELLEGVPYPDAITDGYFVFPYDINTTEWNGTQGWAAGAIISTAADMAKFARALMTGAVFNDPATLAVMTDFIDVTENAEVGNVGGTGYGAGLIEFSPGLWGHRGQTVGFTSIVAMDPAKDFVLIALTNSAEGSVGDEQQLMGHYLHLDE